jgi:hypothetical protein
MRRLTDTYAQANDRGGCESRCAGGEEPLIETLLKYAREVGAIVAVGGALVYIAINAVLGESLLSSGATLAFQVITLSGLLTLLIVSLSARRTSKAVLDSSIQWLSQPPFADQLVQELNAKKVYFIAAFLGHAAPAARRVLDHTGAAVEIYCPDPNLAHIPSYGIAEQSGHLAMLSSVYKGNRNLRIYATANPPGISAAVFVGPDDSALATYLSWYTMYCKRTDNAATAPRDQVMRGNGYWGVILVRKGANEVASQLLTRTSDYLSSLRDDPTRRALLA